MTSFVHYKSFAASNNARPSKTFKGRHIDQNSIRIAIEDINFLLLRMAPILFPDATSL